MPTTNPKPVHGIYRTRTPEQRVERASNAGKAGNSHEALAKRIANNWPKLTQHQQDVIRTVLRPVIGGDTR
jgi:hypothetical protein